MLSGLKAHNEALAAALASGASALASSWALRAVELGATARLALALAPVPFFLWFLAAEARSFRAVDEFHRRVIADALAAAFPGAILLGVTVDSLQKGGFVPDWSVGDVWPFMALLFVPALALAWRRYTRRG